MKRVALSLLLVPAAILLAGLAVLAAVDDASLVSWLVGRIEAGSGVQVSYHQPPRLTRGLAPSLELESLKITNAGRGFEFEADSLAIQVSLPALLTGRLDVLRLALGDTRVRLQDLSQGGEGLNIDPARFWFKPVLHDVHLASLSVVAAGENWRLPAGTVSELSLRLTPDATTPELSADVVLEGNQLHVDALLPAFYRAAQWQPLPFVVRITGEQFGGELKGQADTVANSLQIGAELQLHAADLSRWPVGVDGFRVPGELGLRATLSGPLNHLAAETIDVHWRGGGQSAAQLAGRIDDLIALAGIQLQLNGRMDAADWLNARLPASLAPLSRASLAATLSGTRSRLLLDDVALDAETGEQLSIQLGGSCQLAQQTGGSFVPEHVAATLAFAAPVTRAARALLFDAVPELGAIKGSAVIRSQSGAPALEDINIETHDGHGTQVALRGAIGQFPLAPDEPNRGYDLAVTMRADKAVALTKAVGLQLPLSGPLNLTFRIEGDTPALALNAIQLSAGSKRAVSLTADGNLQFGSWARPDPLDSLDLRVDAHSRTTQALGKLLGTAALPELGGLAARGRVHTVAGKHRVDDIALQTLKGAAVNVKVTGSAAALVVLPRPALAGIELQLAGSGADTASLNSVLALADKPIPSLGAFEVHSRISGSDTLLNIDGTEVAAGKPSSLEMTARGRLGTLSARNGWTLRDTDLKLVAKSESSQALARLMGYRLPPLGPLSAGAVIQDRNAVLVLDALRLRLGAKGREPVLMASGQVGNLRAGQQVSIDARVNLDGHNLAAFADRKKLKDLAPLTGTVRIADRNGVLGIQALQLNSDHPDLTVAISGDFRDFNKPQTLQLKSQVKARDLALVGALFDQEWPAYGPLEVDSNLGREGERLRINTVVKAGKKGLDADLHGDFSVAPPRFAGKLRVYQMPFPDLFARASETRGALKKLAPAQPKQVFSREPIDLGWLNGFDLALAVDIVSFDQDDSRAVSADMTVSLQSGLLKLDPVTIDYPKGSMSLALTVDARRVPRTQFALYGKDLNPWLEMGGQDSTQSKEFNADLDADIRLTASGNSVYALASSLDGNMYLTVRHGKMRRSLLDLLFIDIVGWTVSHTQRYGYTDVICGVADFSARQGVISTNGFFLDLKDISITGQGDIDLGKESVDYVFLPKKKSRFILKAEPVKVRGPLANPSVSAIPVASAVRTFGTLLFAPYVFVGMTATDYLLGRLDSKGGDAPCLNYERTHHMADTLEKSPSQP
jgi:hypothetical protein